MAGRDVDIRGEARWKTQLKVFEVSEIAKRNPALLGRGQQRTDL